MNPKISIVVTGRNDDYGGDFNFRLQNSINWWSYYTRQYKIEAEYIFVNWNPIEEKPSLRDVIEWNTNKYFGVTFVEVPPGVHQAFDKPDVRKKNQLYEFIAKNTGIRRAKGEFILSTNADILCDPAIFQFIAENKLQPDCFYRADRYDFHQIEVDESTSSEQLLERIRKNVFMAHCFGKSFPFFPARNFVSSIAKYKRKSAQFRWWNLFKAKHPNFFNSFHIGINLQNAEFQIHTNASGDFMFMHRNLWHTMKAYNENFYTTLHNDSELLFNVYAAGNKLKVFFYPIYHQDHVRRYSDINPDLQKEAYGVYLQLQKKAQRLLKTMQPEIENDDNWGAERV